MLTVNRWGYAQWIHIEDEDVFEAWERMTYGGVLLDFNSRLLLEWITDVRFEPFGQNRWSAHVAR